MSLKYKILWVDDKKDEFEDELELIKKYVEDLFFEPTIDFCKTVEEAKEKVTGNKYDVIFSDFNIDESMGDDFIEFVRGSSVNTEVLFYTGRSVDLPKKQFDRVTFFKATQPARWLDLLVQKMKDVISISVEKLQDLTSIRGLVMAEVSDLDVKMTEIIEKYYANDVNEDKKSEFNEHIAKDAEKSLRGNLKKGECKEICKHIWRSKSINEIIKKPNFDSSYKARTINLIMDEISYQYHARLEKFYDDYLNDIINKRNELAHCKSFIDGTTKKEILRTKEENKIYSENDFKKIRKDILNYSKIFDELFQIVGK